MDDDSIDINLRPAGDVAARCIILAALIRRLWLDSPEAPIGDEERASEAFDLRGWLMAEEMSQYLTSEEQTRFDRAVGAFDDEAPAAIALFAEMLATIGWSLGLADLQPPGELGELKTIVQAVPAPWDATDPWIAGRRLRSETEIARERERAELFVWRTEIEPLRRNASAHGKAEYDQIIAEVANEALSAGLWSDMHGAQWSFGGVPVSALEERELERLSFESEARLRAFNWLCGFGEDWDHVPLEI